LRRASWEEQCLQDVVQQVQYHVWRHLLLLQAGEVRSTAREVTRYLRTAEVKTRVLYQREWNDIHFRFGQCIYRIYKYIYIYIYINIYIKILFLLSLFRMALWYDVHVTIKHFALTERVHDVCESVPLTDLSVEALQGQLPLHLVLDPGVRTVLPLQQGPPAVPRLPVGLHQDNANQDLVLYGGRNGRIINEWKVWW